MTTCAAGPRGSISVVVESERTENASTTKDRLVSEWSALKANTYWKLYQTLPWYIMSYLVVFIVIYNACYPNLQKLSYLQIDTRHVEQAWRIYTHVFLHANAIHLTGNCITIFFLTLMLATAHHRQQWRIVILYTLAILQGTFGIGWEKRLVYPDRRFIAVGASGSAYGLLGMNVSALALNWSSMPLRWLRLFVVSFFVAFELVAWYYLYSDRVSVSGHIGGFLGGLMGAPCLLIETSSAVVVAPRNNEIDGDAGTPGTSRNTAAWYCRIVSSSVLYGLYTIAGLVNYFT